MIYLDFTVKMWNVLFKIPNSCTTGWKLLLLYRTKGHFDIYGLEPWRVPVQHALNLRLRCPDLCVQSLVFDEEDSIMLSRCRRELIRVHSCVASCQLEQQTKVLIMGGCGLSEFAIKVGIFTGWSLQITLWKSLMWPCSCIMWVRHEQRHFSNMLKHEDEYSLR